MRLFGIHWLLLVGALPSVAQEFRVTDITIDAQGRVTLQHEASANFYFILLRGTEITKIRLATDLALATGAAGSLSDSTPPSSSRFYRVLGVPLNAPFDSDGDGIDDVTELRLAFLNPFNPADATADFDGDGRSNLDEYRAGTDLAIADAPGLTTIAQTSPAQGERGVAVTRETVLRFSAPLASSVVIRTNQLFAEFGGRRLLSRVELSSDRRKVTLFYLEPLPGSARVRVTFNATNIPDAFGNAVDADGDGVAGGVAIIDFQTLSLDTVPGTAVCGRVFASELAPAASGQMSVNVPLQGVTITVDGREETMRTVTDQFGDFRLEPAPAGEFFVHIDGRTASAYSPTNTYYPFVGKKWESVAGEEVNIGNIYLPRVTAGTLVRASATNETVVTFPDAVLQKHPELAGVTLIVPPNALFSDDGTRGGMIGIAPVPPDRLPAPLPDGVNPALVITVQTDGPGNFDVPVPICFPNLPDAATGQVLPPGAKAGLFSFNHDTGEFELAGSMTVSADGTQVCTDPGVGVPAPGWLFTITIAGADFTTRLFGVSCEILRKLEEYIRAGSPEPPPDDLVDLLFFLRLEGVVISVDGDLAKCLQRPPTKPNGTNQEPFCCVCACKTGKTVYLHNGEEVFERTDLVIPGRGDLQFVMRRTYRSQLDYNGPLGHGWNYDFNEALFFEENGDVTRAMGNSRLDTWKRNPDGSYQAPAGFYSTLQRRADGTFVLRQSDGFQHFYRADGRLFCYQDRFGNQMLFDYDDFGDLDVVIDPFGREIDFVFELFGDGRRRLTRVIDFTGREIVYSYDANFDLVAVRTPVVTGASTGNNFPNGRTERYTYSSGFAQPALNHNLLSVTYPEEVANGGPPALVWTYGTDPNNPVTFDRVLTESEGGTNASGIAAGGTTSFTYEMLNGGAPPGDPDLPRGKATITERNGKVFEFFANELNHHILTRQLTRGLRPGEPAFYESRMFFDVDGQLVRRVFPEGNEIRYRYDRTGPRAAQQNLMEFRRVADAGRGGGEDLVTTFTYEPLYNQLASVTDARGNASGYVPPIGAASAARYTARFFYDYQESNDPVEQAVELGLDLSGIPRGLGDLNEDGRTDQTFGNVVRIEEPTVTLRPDSNEADRLGSAQQPILTQLQWNDRGQRIASIDAEGNVNEYFYYPENDPDGDGQPHLSPYLAISAQSAGYLRSSLIDSRTSTRRTSTVPPVAVETVLRYDPVGNVVTVRNPRGIATEIEYNQLNEPIVVTRGADVTAALASGQFLQNETPFRYRTGRFYDFNGRIVRQEIENRDSTTAGVGQFVDRTYIYDILDSLVQNTVEIDATTTLTTRYRYDPNELPVRTTMPEGNQTLTEYDERDLPIRFTRGFGSADASTFQINYDLNGNAKELVDAEDHDGDGKPEVTTFIYDGFDRRTEMVDALGSRRILDYDVLGNLVRSRVFGHRPGQPGQPNVLLQDARYHYDELNRIFHLDGALFLAQGFNPARAVDLRDQNSDGLVTARLEYDALSRLTFAIEDDLQMAQTIYDGANRVIEVRDHLGNRQLTTFDQNSNPIRVQTIDLSPESLVQNETFTTHYVYDQLDRLVRATDNAGQTARFAYDSRNNLVFLSDPQGTPVADPLGLFPGQINQPGNTATWFYDGLDRAIRQVADLRLDGQGGNALDRSNPFNPDGQITVAYQYDGNSRLIGVVDDNGNRTRFEYDALDRRVRHINADGEEFVAFYDRDHNIRQLTDPNDTVIRPSYDALHRVTRVAVSRGPGVGGTTNVTYEYDGLSRQTRSVDDNGAAANAQVCEYVYDSLSRILEDRQNGQPISTVWSGDSKRLRSVYPGGRVINLTYDAIDRVKTVADQAAQISQGFWIGPGMRELRRNYANNTRLSFLDDAGNVDTGYDAVQRITRLRHLLPSGQPFADREYGYNRANRRTFERRHEDAGLTDRYAHDSVYRVARTQLDQEGQAGAQPRDLQQLAYAYDGVGNRRQLDRTATTGLTTDIFAVNVMNEYVSVGGVNRVHDDNGSLTDDGTRLMTYDYRNRLIEVRDKASSNLIARYFYLSDNRRTRKIVFSQTQPNVVEKETTFFYDGWQVVEERDGQSGQTEVTYVYGATYIDELLQMQRTANHSP